MKRSKQSQNPPNKQEAMAYFEELLHSDGFLSINSKILASLGPIKAVFISCLVNRSKYLSQRNMKREDGSFYFTMDHISSVSGMSRHQIKECKKQFILEGVISIKRSGIPSKEYYYLNLDKLAFLHLPASRLKTNRLASKKLTGFPINNKIIDNNKNNKTNSPLNGKDKPTKKITPSDFDKFYKIYPRKADKGKAKTAFLKLCKKPSKECPTLKELIIAIKKQSKTKKWQTKTYIPYPATWLNNSRWLDEVESMNDDYFDSDKKQKESDPGNDPSDYEYYNSINQSHDHIGCEDP